jgi:predicted TIM-barrel fold metal-dependent hydrolase
VKQYESFDHNPRIVKPRPPQGACDCQLHVFGSIDRYPIRSDAAYVMPTATLEMALRMHRALGIDRGLIVQPTSYGTDFRALLDALAVAGPNYKGCVVLNDSVSDATLRDLHDRGIRVARFNFLNALNLVPSAASIRNTIARVRELGWVVKIQPPADGVAEIAAEFEDIDDIPIVIDHMGRTDLDPAQPKANLRKILDLLNRGNFWIMLSNGYRLSKSDSSWDDVIPVVRAFVAAAPDRVIWASDWPHPLSTKPVPNDADILEFLYRCVPDEEQQRKILVDNPVRLLGFT